MRKVILSLAATGAALAVASPAAAQYYYPQSPYGYGNYGYERYGDPSDYFRRLYNVRRTIGNLEYRRPYSLEAEARTLEQQLRVAARGGLDPREDHYFGARIYDLEVRLNRFVNASRRYGYNGYNGYGGYNGYYSGRDQDREDEGRWRRDRDDDDDRDDD